MCVILIWADREVLLDEVTARQKPYAVRGSVSNIGKAPQAEGADGAKA